MRNKSTNQQNQQFHHTNELGDSKSGNEDMIITGVSTYAQAAKQSNINQSSTPESTLIGKKVKFNRSNTNKLKPNFPNPPSALQYNTNRRPPLLDNPPC